MEKIITEKSGRSWISGIKHKSYGNHNAESRSKGQGWVNSQALTATCDRVHKLWCQIWFCGLKRQTCSFLYHGPQALGS